MSGRMNWDRRRPVREPWYARLDTPNPFAPEPGRVPVERVSKAKRRPNRPVKAPSAAPAAPAGPCLTVRTKDIAEASKALAGVMVAAVWCDGAAVPNPGRVGFACVVVADGVRVEFFSGGAMGTNNSAELLAACSALKIVPIGCSTTVFADSEYVVYGCTTRAPRRKRRLAAGFAVPNADLWRELDALAAGRSINWEWCRGHTAGNPNNALADRLAGYGVGLQK